MRIGVTGATGFIGRALVRRLLAQGSDVQVLARPSPGAAQIEAIGARVVTGDLRDKPAIARLVMGTDVVYHLAAMVDSPGTKAAFIEANLNGTENVLEACLAGGVRRVVYASSIAVYGLAKPGEPIDENTSFDDQPERRDLYAQSKILADQFAMSFSRKTGLPLTVIRPGIVFGSGKPLPIGLLGFHAGKTNFVFGARANRFPIIYVENLVDALQLAAQPDRAEPQQFNIVDDDNLTLASYHQSKSQLDGTTAIFLPGWPVRFVASIVGAASRVLPIAGGALSAHQVERALQDRSYLTRRIRAELGWKPRISLSDALRRSLDPEPAK
jgi:nucleoside-diphosphate-sugar epimerase